MSARKGLTWSKKWHIVDEVTSRENEHYDTSLCGAYLYNAEKERGRYRNAKMPEHLQRIIEGTAKSAGECKRCAKSAGIKTATVELPEPGWRKNATDDENGAVSWEYPDGEIVVYDDGSYEWQALGIHSDDPSRLREAAAALLAAAATSERAS